ncbi:MAG: nicotinate-nucleotide adenylyltransferase [Pseudomonadota bacterium]|nr:MAG: nicotinate-nucleotide adenylyltransferase [Pseudomonadota bacterium]
MIGILGGTFDPVHFGHLRPALEIREQLQLDEVRLVVSARPPHREPPVASALQRLAMLRAAVQGVDALRVDDREMRRAGPSYSVDTLESLRGALGAEPLALIIGMDAFLGLDTWHEWQRIPTLAHLVVTHRPGWSLQQLGGSSALLQLVSERAVEDTGMLHHSPAGYLVFQPVTQLEISATRIRTLVRARKDIHYLVPEHVHQLIKAQAIYG